MNYFPPRRGPDVGLIVVIVLALSIVVLMIRCLAHLGWRL
mgnify:CR=1 FL=1